MADPTDEEPELDQDFDPLLDEGLDEDEPLSDKERRRRRLERILPKVIQRALERGLESGLETLRDPGEALRGVVGEGGKLPKELVSYAFAQVDDTKNAMVRVVAHEIRDFLSATDLSKELQKALTALSFEIRTEIRFIPNDSGGVKPVVKAQVDPPKRTRRKDAPAPEEE